MKLLLKYIETYLVAGAKLVKNCLLHIRRRIKDDYKRQSRANIGFERKTKCSHLDARSRLGNPIGGWIRYRSFGIQLWHSSCPYKYD